MMLTLLAALLLATPALCHYHSLYQDREPEDVDFERTFHVQRQHINEECPPRAICGVAYDFNRTVGGRRLPERRIIRHCTCPENIECPIDAEHRVFSSIKRREYLCQPISDLAACDLEDPSSLAAKQLVERHLVDILARYFRINCVCPRHINPVIPKTPGRLELATTITRVRLVVGLHTTFQDRRCVE
ncbi:uncharacterized protein LOC124116936 [Haliotis rufescens]|uniref:uncharacterized protein LOC124116936 n=1 Tax=Haliotis rufescens TaxID=6454 RepID=UPI001EB09AE5|nr:uncharacterized protein LOC124116936 [Haliotis rufescens]